MFLCSENHQIRYSLVLISTGELRISRNHGLLCDLKETTVLNTIARYNRVVIKLKAHFSSICVMFWKWGTIAGTSLRLLLPPSGYSFVFYIEV